MCLRRRPLGPLLHPTDCYFRLQLHHVVPKFNAWADARVALRPISSELQNCLLCDHAEEPAHAATYGLFLVPRHQQLNVF